MAHKPEPNPISQKEGFEIIEVNGDDQLSNEERAWPVVTLEQVEYFEAAELEEVPTLEITLLLSDESMPEAQEMGMTLAGVIETANAIDIAEGGAGYTLGDRWTEPGKIVISLLPIKPDGACARLETTIRRLSEIIPIENHFPGMRRIEIRAA